MDAREEGALAAVVGDEVQHHRDYAGVVVRPVVQRVDRRGLKTDAAGKTGIVDAPARGGDHARRKIDAGDAGAQQGPGNGEDFAARATSGNENARWRRHGCRQHGGGEVLCQQIAGHHAEDPRVIVLSGSR